MFAVAKRLYKSDDNTMNTQTSEGAGLFSTQQYFAYTSLNFYSELPKACNVLLKNNPILK